MSNFSIPAGLRPYRDKLEKTLRPYVKITTEVVEEAALKQSKFLGKPYLPKSVGLPKASDGMPMYLLAQINFAEVPHLASFPEKGILQFYLSANEMYGFDWDSPTKQKDFRVLYHAETDLEASDLVSNFEQMPSPWNDTDYTLPFMVYSKYKEKRDSCFALRFERAIAPISPAHYQFPQKTGINLFDPALEEEMGEADFEQFEVAISNYYECFNGHRLGGYPGFTQNDPRERFQQEGEPYRLLLQIDSEATQKVDIQWGDMGIANFFIQQSALERLDFSKVLYNWDCG